MVKLYQFLCILPTAMAQSFLDDVAMLCASGFSDDFMFSLNNELHMVCHCDESVTAETATAASTPVKFRSTIKIMHQVHILVAHRGAKSAIYGDGIC